MNKNKVVDIKIIFKTYLKILKIGLKHFRFLNRLLLYKTLETNFQKLFLKTIFQNYFKKQLPNKTLLSIEDLMLSFIQGKLVFLIR